MIEEVLLTHRCRMLFNHLCIELGSLQVIRIFILKTKTQPTIKSIYIMDNNCLVFWSNFIWDTSYSLVKSQVKFIDRFILPLLYVKQLMQEEFPIQLVRPITVKLCDEVVITIDR